MPAKAVPLQTPKCRENEKNMGGGYTQPGQHVHGPGFQAGFPRNFHHSGDKRYIEYAFYTCVSTCFKKLQVVPRPPPWQNPGRDFLLIFTTPHVQAGVQKLEAKA